MSFSARLDGLAFRASERYELVLHDRLRPEERRRFESLTADPEYWGVLRPRGAGNYRAVDRETALLLFSLRQPGPLPAYVVEGDELDRQNRVADQVRAMLLDGILEAETADGKAFDGHRAEAADDSADIDSRSLAALRHAAALDLADARELSVRLYLYGGEPLTCRIRDRFDHRLRVAEFLGLERGGKLRRRVPPGWSLDVASEKPWIYLRRRESSAPARYKLYVGSFFEDLPARLGQALAALSGSLAQQMKIGASALDLLRCDKMVVYFSTLEDLQGFALDLSARIEQLAGSSRGENLGVPFTAKAGGKGQLSWGVDPPDGAIPLAGTFSESWRSWLTSRLASALITASSRDGLGDTGRVERLIRATVERVRLEGVDVSRWTPAADLWSEGA